MDVSSKVAIAANSPREIMGNEYFMRYKTEQ
jgi:hypothetical protein